MAKGEEQATFLKCFYDRKVETIYRCHPDCFKPAKQFPKNTCVETCNQFGTVTTAPRKPVFIEGVSISWSPSWWPQGVPGASITLFTKWVADADKTNAEAACKAAGAQNIENLASGAGWGKMEALSNRTAETNMASEIENVAVHATVPLLTRRCWNPVNG